MNDRDIDAQFDAIVARWDDETAPEKAGPTPPATPPAPRTVQDITAAYAALSRPEPESPEAPDRVSADGEAADGEAADGEAADAPAGEEPEVWRPGTDAQEVEEHFEPGPVQLPPGEDIGYWGALLGLVGGPLLLLWVALTSPFHAGWWTTGGIALFLGGFGLLVMRQPKDRDPFDDDNGARV